MVSILQFPVYSPVKSGDYIRAKIPRYEKKDIPVHLARPFGAGPRPRLGPYSGPDVLYFDRDLKSEETAIEVKILSEKEEVLRTDRSVDYDDFLESE